MGQWGNSFREVSSNYLPKAVPKGAKVDITKEDEEAEEEEEEEEEEEGNFRGTHRYRWSLAGLLLRLI